MEIERIEMKIFPLHTLIAIALACGAQTTCAADNVSSIEQKLQLQETNVQMYSDMQQVASWLNQYCMWNYRFPEGLEQMTWAANQLNQLIPNNPYMHGSLVLIPGADENPVYEYPHELSDVPQQYATAGNAVNRARLIFDPSLNDYMASEYLTDPPEDWAAPPGTITAVSNNQNLFMIWGAGPDGKPLRDPVSHNVRLILGHYVLNYGGG